MDRLKLYVDFPIAKSWQDAVDCITDGGHAWQEDSNDWPSCGGFDSLENFIENFPEQEKDDFIFSDFGIHLVPKGEEFDLAEPFKVGEMVWSSKEIKRVALDKEINSGIGFRIESIDKDGYLTFKETFKSNGKDIKLSFKPDDFCRDGNFSI